MLVLLLGLSAGCDNDPGGPPDSSVEGQAFLAVAGFTTLHLIDLETGGITGPYGLGNAPNWIVPVGNDLFVINSLSNDLSRFRMQDGTITDLGPVDIGLQQNRNPYAGVAVNDSTMYVTNLLENSVSRVRLPDGEISDTYFVGTAPEGLVYDSGILYVVCTGYDFQRYEFGTGSLYRIDTLTDAVESILEPGTNPQFIARDEPGRLHLSVSGNYDTIPGEFWRITFVSGQTKTNRFPVSLHPGRLTVAPWERVYVAAGGWANQGSEEGVVMSYPTDSPGSVATISTGLGAIDVAAFQDPEGNRYVYAACMDDATVEAYHFTDGSHTLAETFYLDDTPQVLAIWQVTDQD
ncbi:hypothetical protein GF324_06115 [bacterium]|nr:hypothetical protein [bacterium]